MTIKEIATKLVELAELVPDLKFSHFNSIEDEFHWSIEDTEGWLYWKEDGVWYKLDRADGFRLFEVY